MYIYIMIYGDCPAISLFPFVVACGVGVGIGFGFCPIIAPYKAKNNSNFIAANDKKLIYGFDLFV